MKEVALSRREYFQRVQANADDDPDFLRGFHADVIGYYTELRPYRDADPLGNKWRAAKMWPENGDWDAPDEHWVKGVDVLSRYIDYKVPAESDSGGWGTRAKDEMVSTYLNSEKLVRASMVLDEIARDLGIAIDVEKGPRSLGMLDEQEPHWDPEEEDVDL